MCVDEWYAYTRTAATARPRAASRAADTLVRPADELPEPEPEPDPEPDEFDEPEPVASDAHRSPVLLSADAGKRI